jgi:hypothetical protein
VLGRKDIMPLLPLAVKMDIDVIVKAMFKRYYCLISYAPSDSDDKKFVFTKDSVNSKIGFEILMKIVSLSKNHLILQSNLEINKTSMIECTSSLFSYLGLSTIQFVRIYSCKQFSKGIYELHAQFIGLNSGELRSINHFVNRNLLLNIASGD